MNLPIKKGYYIPRSLTSIALLFLKPVSWTVTPAPLGTADPSLPFVILNRCIENFETLATLRKISDAGASESTVMDSGRPLIGRPGGVVSLVMRTT